MRPRQPAWFSVKNARGIAPAARRILLAFPFRENEPENWLQRVPL